MQKEILTKEKCIIDIKANFKIKQSFIDYLFYFVAPISVLIAILVYLYTRSSLSWLILLAPIAVIIIGIYDKSSKIKKITTNCVVINEIKCIRISEDLIYKPRTSQRNFNGELRYIMYFENLDRYIVPRRSYEWSKLYSMSDKTVNMTTLEGDTFYVAFLKDNLNTPLAVYNAKLFEYKENDFDNSFTYS